VATEQGRDADAMTGIGKAAMVIEELIRRDPSNRELQYQLADTLIMRVRADNRSSRWAAVMESTARVRELMEPLVRADPSHRDYSFCLSSAWFYSAVAYVNRGEHAEAIRACERAAALTESKIQGPAPALSDMSQLALVYFVLGDAHEKANRPADAELARDKAFSLRRTMLERQPTNTRYVGHLMTSCHSLADWYLSSDQRDAAVRVLTQSRDVLRKVPQPQPVHLMALAQICSRLSAVRGADTEEAHGDADEAMAALKKASAADPRIARTLRSDRHLNPLRQREDFKTLLADLNSPDPVTDKPKP
jgi:tetratricopeptide (TPR) repeat protein